MNSKQPRKTSTHPRLKVQIGAQTEWDVLTPDEVKLFNRHVVCKIYRSGQNIFMQGDTCNGLYFVEHGLVAVRKINIDGQSAIVRLAYQGDTLGYRPLLAKEKHRATAEVIKDAHICFINAQIMRSFLHSNPKLGMRFLEHTALALGEAEERMFQIATLSVRTRIIHLVVLLRDHYGMTTSDGTLFVDLPMSQRDLADMIGARPESVSRAFRDIQDDGLMSISGHTIRIDQVDRLINELHHNLHH